MEKKNLTPDEAELKLLSSITTVNDLAKILQRGIDEKSFVKYGTVFNHFVDYRKTYASIPSADDLRLMFKIDLQEPGDLEYYISEVTDLALVRDTSVVIHEHLGTQMSLMEKNPKEVLRGLLESLRKLNKSDISHVAWLDRDAMQRLGWLQDKIDAKEHGNIIGIPTGLHCFDSTLQGWGKGEAIMVMAPKGVGKSWMGMYFGVVAYHSGFKVLFLSPEMTIEECAYRFDVLLASFHERITNQKFALSHTAITTGQQDEEVYEEWLRMLTRREDFIAVDAPPSGKFNVSSILGLMEEYKPDMMVLDGLHLVGGEAGQAGWEVIKQASDSLKAAAQYLGCTVVWTSQVDKAAMKNSTEPATGASAAYGKASVEAANRLITLAEVKGDPRRLTFKVPNNRSGREFHIKQDLIFDVDVGRIEQVYSDMDLENVNF